MATDSSSVAGVAEEEKIDPSKCKCKWRECPSTSGFGTEERLLEHVLAEHIPTTEEDEDGEEEVVCRWKECWMGTTRGDMEKKTVWMKAHFKSRHVKSVKPFKCQVEGCTVARATSQELKRHVRSAHPVRPEPKQTKPKPEEPDNGLPRFWRIEDGRVIYATPPLVTKNTIVHYADGPRMVYPPCNSGKLLFNSDESELQSDEYWSSIHYSDDEETKRKAWRPPPHDDGPLRFTYPPWYDPKNPPVTDSEEEARRKRPIRRKKKIPGYKSRKLTTAAAKRDNLHAVCEKLGQRSEPMTQEDRDEMERAKCPGWVGSFWHQYLEKQKAEREERKRLKALEAEKAAAEKAAAEKELSMPPELKKEPKKSPRKRQAENEEMPVLTAPDEEPQAQEVHDPPARVLSPSRRPLSRVNDESEGVLSDAEDKSPETRKRLSRACRMNASMVELDDDIYLGEELCQKVPVLDKLEAVKESPSKKRGRPRKSDSPLDKTPEKAPGMNLEESSDKEKVILDPKPEKIPDVKTRGRPSRACRALGSMEEVPFDIEIAVEWGEPLDKRPIKRRKIEKNEKNDTKSLNEEKKAEREKGQDVRC